MDEVFNKMTQYGISANVLIDEKGGRISCEFVCARLNVSSSFNYPYTVDQDKFQRESLLTINKLIKTINGIDAMNEKHNQVIAQSEPATGAN